MGNEYELEEKLKGTPKQKSAKIYKSNTISSTKSEPKKTVSNNIPKASFHTQKATQHSSEHIKRESKITYLLIHDCKKNEYKKYDDLEEYKTQAERIYKEKIGQKMQSKSKENLIKEAVLNIKSSTSISDLENTFKELNKRFGGHFPLEIGIHKDEGVFIDTQYDINDLEYTSKTLSWKHLKLNIDVTNEVIDYAPNRNIFFNQEDKTWYYEKQFENKADISSFQQKINYHAHVIYSNFYKETGKTARMNRTDMRELQTIVADSLKMRRGQEFSNAKRMTHWQLKAAIDAKREMKINNLELAKQKDLKSEMKIIREEFKERSAPRKDYAALEQMNKDLKEKIKIKELTVQELHETIKEKVETITYQNKLLIDKDQKIKSYSEEDKRRGLFINNEIPKERIKVKDGLLGSKEKIVYRNESVETFIEQSKSEKQKLTDEKDNLEKQNSKLLDFVQELRTHFKKYDLNELSCLIKAHAPKVQNIKSNYKNKDHER